MHRHKCADFFCYRSQYRTAEMDVLMSDKEPLSPEDQEKHP